MLEMKFSLLLCFYGDISLLFELVCKMYFTHSPPLSLCWYDGLVYELWIHDLCLNPDLNISRYILRRNIPSTLPRLVTRPRHHHLTTWRGVTSRVTRGDPAAVMRCLDGVTSPDPATAPHAVLRRDSYWKLFWHNIRGGLFDCAATYCCSGLVSPELCQRGPRSPVFLLYWGVLCARCWLSSPH